MKDDLLLSDDELEELTEGALAEYEALLSVDLDGLTMDRTMEGEGTTRAAPTGGRLADAPSARRARRGEDMGGEVKLHDGTIIFCDGADDGALRLQGRNLRACWSDEIGLWKRWQTAFDEPIA